MVGVSIVQTCKSIPFTGVRVGAIRAEITGGKGRSVTLCPPSGAFYSVRIRALSLSRIKISYDTSIYVHKFVRIKKRHRIRHVVYFLLYYFYYFQLGLSLLRKYLKSYSLSRENFKLSLIL